MEELLLIDVILHWLKKKTKYESKAYIKAFKKETTEVVDALEEFADKLIELEDDILIKKMGLCTLHSSTYKSI